MCGGLGPFKGNQSVNVDAMVIFTVMVSFMLMVSVMGMVRIGVRVRIALGSPGGWHTK